MTNEPEPEVFYEDLLQPTPKTENL